MAGVVCQFRVSIPEGAQAGAVLSIDRGQGDNLKVLVPEGATQGDELLLTQTAGGAWSASTVLGGLPVPDSIPTGDKSAASAPGPSFEEQLHVLQAGYDRMKAENSRLVDELSTARERATLEPRDSEGAEALRAECAALRRELASRDELIRQLSNKDSASDSKVEDSTEPTRPLQPAETEELRNAVTDRDTEILRLRTGFELLGREIVRLHGALRSTADARVGGRSEGMSGRPLGVVPDWAGSADKRPNPAATSSKASELRGEASRIQESLGSGTVLHDAVGGLRSSIAVLEEALAAVAGAREDQPGSASTKALAKARAQATPWPGNVQAQRSPSPAVRGAAAPMGWQTTAPASSSWNMRPGKAEAMLRVQPRPGYPGAVS